MSKKITEPEEVTDDLMDLMEDVSTEDVEEYDDVDTETLVHELGLELETVDNLDKDPLEL